MSGDAILVQYRVKSVRAAENEELIACVCEELARERPDGIRYVSFKAADGVSSRTSPSWGLPTVATRSST